MSTDFMPVGSGPKKPLSKKELEKMKKMYAQSSVIIAKTKEQEAQDKQQEAGEIENLFNELI